MELERKIEKLLRAYAKKRRADAGDAFTLHPVTRRRLQDATARRAPGAEDEDDSVSLWELFRRQWAVLVGFALIIFLGSALFFPTLSKAKFKSQKVAAVSNLKQIGMAVQMAAADNRGRLPATLDALTNGFVPEKVLTDPESGKQFAYAAGGRTLGELRNDDVVAYSPGDKKDRAVLFADGSVQRFGREKFSELTNRGLPEIALAENQPREEMGKLSVATTPSAAPAPAVMPPVAGEFAGAGGIGNGTLAARSLTAAKPATTTAAEPLTVTTSDVSGFLAHGGGGNKLSYGLGADSVASPAAVPGNNLDKGYDSSGVVAGLPVASAPVVASGTALGTSSLAVAQNSLYFKSLLQTNTAQFALNNNSQRFVRALAVAAKTPPVLASFEFQQNGTALAVVDHDGSVYNGTLQPVEPAVLDDLSKAKEELADTRAGKLGAAQKEKDLGVVANTLSAAQNYSFRVAGFNRTLNQNVVFTGNVIGSSNVTANVAQNFSNQAVSGRAGQFQSANANVSQALFSNSRIEGTATIDRTNRIEINAVPVAP